MHIVLYSYNYYPEILGIPKTNTMLAELLVKRGHKVSVITAFPHYPFRKPMEGYKNKYFLKERHNGVDIYRSYIYISDEQELLKRIWHEFSFILSSIVSFFRVKNADVVISVCPPLLGTLLASVFCKLRRKPLVLLIKDILPDSAVSLGFISNKAVISLLKFIEKLNYRLADRIVAISGLFKKNLLSKGVSVEKIECFYEFVDTDKLYPAPKDASFLGKMGLDDKFVVLYSGNIGHSQGLNVIPQAALILDEKKDILFVISGEGSKKNGLREMVSAREINNIKIIPPVAENDLCALFNLADVFILTQKKEIMDINFPYKLSNYMAAGKAIVAAVNPGNEVAGIARDTGAYVLIPPEDALMLAKTITDLYNDSGRRKDLGRKARDYALEKFSKTNFTEKYENMLQDLVGGTKT